MDNVMSFSRVQLFKKYAPYMSEEDQATYTNHVIEELRLHLSYAKSKSYGYIVDDIKGMYTCCEVSKKFILDFVEEIEYNYGNRPALMRLLRSWFRGNLLITCRFLVVFLVVSKKKRIFSAEVLNIEGIDYEKYE